MTVEESHSQEPTPDGPSCRNCGQPAPNAFCPFCGQSTRDINLPLKEVIGVWLGAIVAFDSRLFRTLQLLIRRPGALTVEFVQGRRRSAVHPLKLFLSFSLLLFVGLGWSGYSIVNLSDDDTTTAAAPITFNTTSGETTPADPVRSAEGPPESKTPRWLSTLANLYLNDPKHFNSVFINRLAKAVFILVPVFALLLKGLYRQRLYVDHLVFSLHQHSFAFLAILVELAVNLLIRGADEPGTGFAALVVAVYTFLALRRCYSQSRLLTSGKMLLLFFGYLIALIMTMIATLFATSLTL